jgi:hypothetical protein
MKFPNGFTSWMETHHEVVAFITKQLMVFDHTAAINQDAPHKIYETASEVGTYGMYDLAKAWTNEFEELNKGRKWDGDGDYFDEIEKFCEQKNKS